MIRVISNKQDVGLKKAEEERKSAVTANKVQNITPNIREYASQRGRKIHQ